MKALSLTQPWASLVVEGHKIYETRSWKTEYQGLLVIHAAKGFPGWAKRLLLDEDSPFACCLNRPPEEVLTGGIVGVVDLGRCIPTWQAIVPLFSNESAFGDFGPDRFAWELHQPRITPFIPCKGKLGLWTVPPEIEVSLVKALAEQ